ncbi:phenylpropionate dioxygenase-like ring-hydroxylating dioxygenase large terminal subunit [Rhodococcus sp. 27YEA15]|uniref:Rieske 2Fe-2S domain-containing protein n=1 Tax=Rhodococcus sp. 27YEA15 TaxID=3156259 RepID=UPI003C7DBDEC
MDVETMPRPKLTNFWHPIGTSDEVIDQPRPFKLLGEQLVAYRDADGVVVMNDLCIHRGAALSLGSVNDGRITCAYHGWQYDRTGACARIPSLPEGTTIPRKAKTLTYRAQERYGLVWVALEDPVEPIPQWPLDSYDDPGFRTYLAHKKVWHGSAGRACEGALDFSHFNHAHAGYLELIDEVITPFDVKIDGFNMSYTYNDSVVQREYVFHSPFTMFITKHLVGSLDQSLEWDARSVTEDGVTVVSQLHTPLDDKSCIVYMHVGRNHHLDMDDSEFAGQLGELVADQDRLIVESQRPERVPLDLREELHIKVPDATGMAYRRMMNKIDGMDGFI